MKELTVINQESNVWLCEIYYKLTSSTFYILKAQTFQKISESPEQEIYW